MRKILAVAVLVVLLGLTALPVWSATALVQRKLSKNDFGDTTLEIVMGSDVTAGNLLVLGVEWSTGVATITVADSQSNTWTEGQSLVSGSVMDVSGWYAKDVAAGATTVTVTFSSAPSRQHGAVHEVSGADTSAPFDQSTAQGQSNPGTGTDAVTSGNVTTGEDGEYIFGMTSDANAQLANTEGTGYTLGETVTGTADEHQIQTSAGSIAATFTIPGFANPTTMIMTFKESAAAPAPRRRVIPISEMLKYAPTPILADGLGLAWVINRRNKLLRGK